MKRTPSTGYTFSDLELLERSLTHSSYAHEHGTKDNERLEFLGDAVLQLFITHWIIKRFPTRSEGELSKLRSRLVNTDTLAEVGRGLRLGTFLRLGKGEAATGGKTRVRNLACVTEALLGAIYEDGGPEPAAAAVRRWFGPTLTILERGKAPWESSRGRLQELTQGLGLGMPIYSVRPVHSEDHPERFHATVSVADDLLGEGVGRNKRGAFKAAAIDALEKWTRS